MVEFVWIRHNRDWSPDSHPTTILWWAFSKIGRQFSAEWSHVRYLAHVLNLFSQCILRAFKNDGKWSDTTCFDSRRTYKMELYFRDQLECKWTSWRTHGSLCPQSSPAAIPPDECWLVFRWFLFCHFTTVSRICLNHKPPGTVPNHARYGVILNNKINEGSCSTHLRNALNAGFDKLIGYYDRISLIAYVATALDPEWSFSSLPLNGKWLDPENQEWY